MRFFCGATDSKSFSRVVKRAGFGKDERNTNPPFTADDFNGYLHGISEIVLVIALP